MNVYRLCWNVTQGYWLSVMTGREIIWFVVIMAANVTYIILIYSLIGGSYE